jgi:glycosyltransferase involved in cell wall biosynthesis
MRIGLLAHDLADPVGRGLQRYTAGLARVLSGMKDVDLVLFARSAPLPKFDDVRARREIWSGRRELLWEQVDLPARLRQLRIDVVHAPANRGLPAYSPCPTVLTRHDEIERMFAPDFPGSRRSRFRRQWSDRVSIARASQIVCVSQRTATDVQREWKLGERRITVCGEGIDERFFQGVSAFEIARVKRQWNVKEKFVLYVGGFDRRKDVPTLVQAFLKLQRKDLVLLLCGPLRGDGDTIKKMMTSDDRVIVTGPVPDEDLPALYAGCELFVYPSRYEGFGLQTIEAMASGAPVLTSDGGALPEIGGSAAGVFPAGDISACVQTMRELLENPEHRGRLACAGRAHAEQFRWRHVAARYVSLYRRLAS